MQLVEQHVIRRGDGRYEAIDQAAFASKNLYNAANYIIRQAFIFQGVYLGYTQMHHVLKSHPAYQALPRKVSQQVLRTLDKNWQSFFKAEASCSEHPEKFLGHPSLPKYKHKTDGRNLLIYTIQALSKPMLRQGYIHPSGLPIRIKTNHQNVKQVRIIPRHGFSMVEVVYQQEPVQADVAPALYAGIDIGVNNLATLTSNKKGFVPRIVNGRPVKSVNQFYNKRKAQLDQKLMKMDARRRTSHQLERLTETHYLLPLHTLDVCSSGMPIM